MVQLTRRLLCNSIIFMTLFIRGYIHSMYQNMPLISQHLNSDFLKKNPLSCQGVNHNPQGTKPMRYQLSYPGLDYTSIVKSLNS